MSYVTDKEIIDIDTEDDIAMTEWERRMSESSVYIEGNADIAEISGTETGRYPKLI